MTFSPDTRIAVVTGASSGIGEATARTLASQGFHVVIGARRLDRLEKIAEDIGGTALELDVTDQDSVDAFSAVLPRVDVLVNNAGGAKGLATVADADLDDWRWMWETNVLGTLRITKALLPKLVESGDGLIVTITSLAALEAYDNGSGYTTAKHAEGVLHRTLRGELLASRSVSPRSHRAQWKPSSPWCVSKATRSAPTRSTRASPRSSPRTSRTSSGSSPRGPPT